MFADLTGNDCISQQASNPYEMSDLSENLRINCTEGNMDAVVVPRVMMESLVDDPAEKKCEKGSEIERICKLEKENDVLHQKIKELNEKVEALKNFVNRLRQNEEIDEDKLKDKSEEKQEARQDDEQEIEGPQRET